MTIKNLLNNINTVVEKNDSFNFLKDKDKLNPMDVVMTSNTNIGIVLVGPLNIPALTNEYVIDKERDFEINNPVNWQMYFEGYIIYNIEKEKHEVVSHQSLKKMNLSIENGYIFNDAAAEKLKLALGLINLMNKSV